MDIEKVQECVKYWTALHNIRERRKIYKLAKNKALQIFNIHINQFYESERYINKILAKKNSLSTVAFIISELRERVPCMVPEFNNDRIKNYWEIVIKQINKI